MILKSLNDVSEYSLSNTFEVSGVFNGHQKGIAICSLITATGEIEKNYLPEYIGDKETRDKMLRELIDDKSILKIEQQIRTFTNDDIVSKTIIYLPYIVTGHSCYEPILDFVNIPGVKEISVKVKIELLFVVDNLNRYAVIEYDTAMISIIDIVYHCLSEPKVFNQLGCVVDDSDGSFTLDFYNEIGEKENIQFPNVKRLQDSLVSIRLVGMVVPESKVQEVLKDV